LGVVENLFGDRIVIADLPGVIEGASRGVGLGNRFLRHVQRALFLVHVLDGSLSREELLRRHEILLEEISQVDTSLRERLKCLFLNKSDLLSEREREEKVLFLSRKTSLEVFWGSALYGENLTPFLSYLFSLMGFSSQGVSPSYALGR